uniref:L1 transposable element RRM domain-containing protein n=1 Tax=Maylandia zebra TaxID=106582 RepID=A0A3P9B3V8_9CICH
QEETSSRTRGRGHLSQLVRGDERNTTDNERLQNLPKATANPARADNMPQWAQDMMSEIKKTNAEITKYREETKTEIMRCKEEIEKGRKESKAEMEKWLLCEEVRLISETSVSLANKMEARKKEVDDTLNDQSDSITSMETKLKELEKEMLMLRRRSEDLEARSRRNMGVREGAETGKTPSEFIAGLLKEKLGLSVTPTLDRAHRTLGARRDGAGAPPRAFVVRCHYYIEKEEILRKAREMERTPEGRSGRIHIFPDYTQEVNNKRAAFKEARSLLRTYGGVRYRLRYPATLVITPEGGQTKTFETPKDAMEFIKKTLTPG